MPIPFIGGIIKAGADIANNFMETRKLKSQGKIDIQKEKSAGAVRIATAKANAEVERLNAQSQRKTMQLQGEFDYDQQVLKNRQSSWADEFIIVCVFSLLMAPFIGGVVSAITGGENVLAQVVQDGWKAHGYDGMPKWMEFAIVGILVSTLGLLRMFSMWFGKRAPTKPVQTKGTGGAFPDFKLDRK